MKRQVLALIRKVEMIKGNQQISRIKQILFLQDIDVGRVPRQM